MNALIENIQIIERDGKPEYAVIPYDQFTALAGVNDEPTIPHEVVGLVINNGMSIIKAWRTYMNLTQREIAERAGITPSAMAQIEKSDRPHKATLERIAEALGLSVGQLEA